MDKSDSLPETTPPNTPHTPATRYTPIEEIIELIGKKGLSYEKAGKVLGISAPSVWERCKRHGIIPKGLNRYRGAKLDLIDSKASLLLYALTWDKIKKLSPYQLVGMYGILYDKARLEADKSTQNINLQGVLGKLESKLQNLEEEKERLEK